LTVTNGLFRTVQWAVKPILLPCIQTEATNTDKLRNALFDVGKCCVKTCSVSQSAELSLAAFSENSALHESTERLHARSAYSVAHLRNCVTIGMPETLTAKNILKSFTFIFLTASCNVMAKLT